MKNVKDTRRMEATRVGLAQAVVRNARHEAMARRNVMRGTVIAARPLRVELVGAETVLTTDDFDLSAWADFYRDQYGVARGDTALLMREAGEWILFDWIAGSDTGARPLIVTEKRTKRALARLDSRIRALDKRLDALEAP